MRQMCLASPPACSSTASTFFSACSNCGAEEVLDELVPAPFKREVRAQRGEIERRRKAYRRGRARLDVAGKSVVVVDDGIATGTTVRAALQALRRMRPARLILAVPVAPTDTIYELSPLVDDVVCLSQPAFFRSVGTYYADFPQVDDDEVIALLDAARSRYET